MKIYTIGFTKKTADQFIGLLASNGVKRVIDIRLFNTSEHSGYAQKFVLMNLLQAHSIGYVHRLDLAPTKELFNDFRASMNWQDCDYENRFKAILAQRNVINTFPEELIDGSCFLCAEPTADNCHRRLVVESLQCKFPDLEIIHL